MRPGPGPADVLRPQSYTEARPRTRPSWINDNMQVLVVVVVVVGIILLCAT